MQHTANTQSEHTNPHNHWIVLSFTSTFDALETERVAGEQGVAGRIIPLPVQIGADCGLAWRMEPSHSELQRLLDSLPQGVVPAGIHEL